MSKKVLKGRVVSNKSKKTIVVLVERKYQHPFLRKINLKLVTLSKLKSLDLIQKINVLKF